jgi:hypothetical protein
MDRYVEAAFNIILTLAFSFCWASIGSAVWAYEKFDWADCVISSALIFFAWCGNVADVWLKYVREAKPR